MYNGYVKLYLPRTIIALWRLNHETLYSPLDPDMFEKFLNTRQSSCEREIDEDGLFLEVLFFVLYYKFFLKSFSFAHLSMYVNYIIYYYCSISYTTIVSFIVFGFITIHNKST